MQFRLFCTNFAHEKESKKIMSKRYFVTLSYDGTNYHGWQVQPNGISVQGELQRVLSTLLRQEIAITGAGRTDAGVHARVMVAHFDFDGEVDCKQLAYKMNLLICMHDSRLPSAHTIIIYTRVRIRLSATIRARFIIRWILRR